MLSKNFFMPEIFFNKEKFISHFKFELKKNYMQQKFLMCENIFFEEERVICWNLVMQCLHTLNYSCNAEANSFL